MYNYGYPYVPNGNWSNPNVPFVQRRSEIIRVHGEAGAQAYQMAPNSDILLLDDTNPILWFKSTDGAGYPTIVAYDIIPHIETKEIVQPAYDYSALEERISKLERRLNNGKSYSGNARSAKPAEPAITAEPSKPAGI